MTHTPGEWNYSKCGNDADQWAVYDESGRTIGLSYHGEDNARLFSAASDLLLQLKLLVRWAEDQGEKCSYARAAIEKATAPTPGSPADLNAAHRDGYI